MTGAWIAAWATWAFGQEPVQNFDPVLVTTVQAEGEATPADAARVMSVIEGRFRENNPVIPMADVPAFDVQGYDATQYMNVCPAGQYAGCALVVAQRTDAVWAVGATVAKLRDEFDPNVALDKVTVYFIDVLGGEVVARFDVVLDGAQDAQVIDGIGLAYDQMVQGAYDDKDVRGEIVDPVERAARQKAWAAAVAASLEQLEAELGDVVKGEVIVNTEPPKVTRAELDAFDTREEVAPWERVGMAKGEYRRFANSGKDLLTWRKEANGRFGQILGRVAVGGGSGPYSQRYVSQVLLDGSTLQPAHTIQLNEVIRGGTGAFDIELGFGVAPWVEVTGVVGFRTGKVSVLVDEDVDGQVAIAGNERSSALNTTQFGVRGAFVPLNHSMIRPSLGLGVAGWSGASVEGSERSPAAPKPTTTFLEILPGAEVAASPTVNLFARGVIATPLAGRTSSFEEEGTGMPNPPALSPATSRTGFAFQAGLTVRVGPFWKIDDRTGGAIRVDDEEPDF